MPFNKEKSTKRYVYIIEYVYTSNIMNEATFLSDCYPKGVHVPPLILVYRFAITGLTQGWQAFESDENRQNNMVLSVTSETPFRQFLTTTVKNLRLSHKNF